MLRNTGGEARSRYAVLVTRRALTREELIAAERRRLTLPPHGRLSVGIGYPNSYSVGMSSLAFQWVAEIAAHHPDAAVERFVADEHLAGVTLDGGRPLGDLDVLAFSLSFELDAVHLLRILDAAGVPRRRRQRDRHPLVVVGGAVASINPLPLADAVDVFAVGAAELLLPDLLELTGRMPSREALLAELALRDGFFVPEHHLGPDGWPAVRVRRIEKRDRHMTAAAMVPASHAVTEHTEYRRRGLVEMSRGCPEKCRYCWVSHNYGRLRCYPADAILDRVQELAAITDRVGFVATAVGDHPELARILAHSHDLGMDIAISSLRIPSVVAEVLEPLAASGARSITIAPETGSDELRRRLNKPIPNDRILAAVDSAQVAGIPNLKMYFIIGLPGESDDDVLAIADLLRASHEIIVAHGRARGQVGALHAGFSILVPKPYTPYGRESMIDGREARRRLRMLESVLARVPNLRWDRPSYREARWQAYLARAGSGALPLLERAADGAPLGRLLADHATEIDRVTLQPATGTPPWQFITSAPAVSASSD